MRQTPRGFTLLELLVAMAIFAFIGIMAYGGLAAMMKNAEGSRQAREQLAEMQRALRIIDDDLSQVINRPVHDGLGSPHLALMTGRDGSTLLEFTRTARVTDALTPSPYSRVRYRLENDNIIRETWNPPDAANLAPDQSMRLWQGVAQVRLTFLEDGKESEQWPPPNVENMSLPQAISLQIQLNDGREINQVVLLPDAGLGDAMNAPAQGGEGGQQGKQGNQTSDNPSQDTSNSLPVEQSPP